MTRANELQKTIVKHTTTTTQRENQIILIKMKNYMMQKNVVKMAKKYKNYI